MCWCTPIMSCLLQGQSMWPNLVGCAMCGLCVGVRRLCRACFKARVCGRTWLGVPCVVYVLVYADYVVLASRPEYVAELGWVCHVWYVCWCTPIMSCLLQGQSMWPNLVGCAMCGMCVG